MLALEKDGVKYPLAIFREQHPNIGFAGDIPPQAILDRYGYSLISISDPTPQSITRAQAKLALLQVGLLDDVQPAIDAIPDPIQRKAAQIEWNDRLTFERTNPTLIALAGMLGMTDSQLDELFVLGATL